MTTVRVLMMTKTIRNRIINKKMAWNRELRLHIAFTK